MYTSVCILSDGWVIGRPRAPNHIFPIRSPRNAILTKRHHHFLYPPRAGGGINLLKPTGYAMHQQISRSTAVRSAHLLTYLLTYLLTPWCRVLLEQLTGLELVKKFPTFHGTRRFITALTSVRHLSLSWASPIQSIYPHPTVFTKYGSK